MQVFDWASFFEASNMPVIDFCGQLLCVAVLNLADHSSFIFIDNARTQKFAKAG